MRKIAFRFAIAVGVLAALVLSATPAFAGYGD